VPGVPNCAGDRGVRKPAVSHKRAAALGWTRVDPKPWSKLDALWLSSCGWRIEHCGHPTANWPWALYDPKGRMHLYGGRDGRPTCGVAWGNLEDAMSYVYEWGHDAVAAMNRDELERPNDIRWHPDAPFEMAPGISVDGVLLRREVTPEARVSVVRYGSRVAVSATGPSWDRVWQLAYGERTLDGYEDKAPIAQPVLERAMGFGQLSLF
jgi:hypothetical protein